MTAVVLHHKQVTLLTIANFHNPPGRDMLLTTRLTPRILALLIYRHSRMEVTLARDDIPMVFLISTIPRLHRLALNHGRFQAIRQRLRLQLPRFKQEARTGKPMTMSRRWSPRTMPRTRIMPK